LFIKNIFPKFNIFEIFNFNQTAVYFHAVNLKNQSANKNITLELFQADKKIMQLFRTSNEIKSDRSSNTIAFFNPQICLILLYGGRPLSRPL
jgi:hypothetical protein